MKKLLPSAMVNSKRGDVTVHSDPAALNWSLNLRRSYPSSARNVPLTPRISAIALGGSKLWTDFARIRPWFCESAWNGFGQPNPAGPGGQPRPYRQNAATAPAPLSVSTGTTSNLGWNGELVWPKARDGTPAAAASHATAAALFTTCTSGLKERNQHRTPPGNGQIRGREHSCHAARDNRSIRS